MYYLKFVSISYLLVLNMACSPESSHSLVADLPAVDEIEVPELGNDLLPESPNTAVTVYLFERDTVECVDEEGASGFNQGSSETTNCIDASKSEITNLDMSESDLSGSTFAESKIKDVNFKNSSLEGTNFQKTELVNVTLGGNSLDGANFSGAKLISGVIDDLSVYDELIEADVDISTQVSLPEGALDSMPNEIADRFIASTEVKNEIDNGSINPKEAIGIHRKAIKLLRSDKKLVRKDMKPTVKEIKGVRSAIKEQRTQIKSVVEEREGYRGLVASEMDAIRSIKSRIKEANDQAKAYSAEMRGLKKELKNTDDKDARAEILAEIVSVKSMRDEAYKKVKVIRKERDPHLAMIAGYKKELSKLKDKILDHKSKIVDNRETIVDHKGMIKDYIAQIKEIRTEIKGHRRSIRDIRGSM
ncbi:MAG: pentapeptide repeat-containing protein [Bdellovibrionales bacterium]